MNKILSILFVVFAVFICLKSYDKYDINDDISYAIASENAFVNSDLATCNLLNNKIVDTKKRFIPNKYFELKRDILSKKFDSKTIGTKISALSNSNQKVALYSLAAKGYRQSDKDASDVFIFRAYCNLLGANYVAFESLYLETANILSDIDDKMAQETATTALINLRYSHDKGLLIYKLMSKKYSRQKLLKLWTSDKKNHKRHQGAIWHAKVLSSKKTIPQERLEKAFRYTAIQFAMPWSIKKWDNYKIPMLAYICFSIGDAQKYVMYREQSLSPEQLKDMQAGYFQYVEYAARIFCLTGDYDDAIKLLQTLPDGHNKRRVLKRLIRYLTATKQGLEKTLKTELL